MPTVTSRRPLLDTLSGDTMQALRCPAWCVEDPDHGLTDHEMAVSGGIWREHHGADTVVAGVRVRIASAVDYSLDHGLLVLPPTVQVVGPGETDLVAEDAQHLATVIAEHVAGLTGVRA